MAYKMLLTLMFLNETRMVYMVAMTPGAASGSQNITLLLDSLVEGYNKQLRPGFGVRIIILGVGGHFYFQMFSINCYFRQSWEDKRLSFTPVGNITELRPSVTMFDNLWKPDTFFLNGRTSYLHTVTSSNKLFRITSSGKILYSQSFVFAALVEYAGVNYFTKTGSKEGSTDSEEEADPSRPLLTTATYSGGQSVQHTLTTDINGHTVISVNKTMTHNTDSCLTMFLHCLRGNTDYRNIKSLSKTGNVSVSKIDSMAKIIFPFTFLCLNIFYWAGFIYYF
ncbi:hypothetical protein LSH36_84g02025 [Paralvinella palmiformis]|uniref:Neurotransmitter-gated ion-channel ligand-binding domain-containing protein n=1 Tax=Paralvinella palmiformis TaxID=53620 RepID=A0AAD9NAJ9_9ANNE|nr:hypothetical protein LSH36_84g02025 [Paralvinella palmiformis]